MGFTMRLPSINAPTPEGQMQQMRGYLFQLAQEMEFAINSIESGTAIATGPTGVQRSSGREARSGIGENFGEIKSLIIKSADIVNAYYDKITEKFNGHYFADSDFGAYLEDTSQTLERTSTAVTQLFDSIQQLTTQIDGMTEVMTNAYIRTGELYKLENGMPVYGIEIGQSSTINGENVFRKFARFASDRLSFYDKNGTEVAFVSDSTLNITNVQIKNEMIAGGYAIDLSDGMAWKWIGE